MRMIVCLVVAAMLASCQNKQPYELAVDKYLEDHLKDPGSYQNVELGSPQLITPMTKALEETTRRVKAGELPGGYSLAQVRCSRMRNKKTGNVTDLAAFPVFVFFPPHPLFHILSFFYIFSLYIYYII